jgi:hypothetical protein
VNNQAKLADVLRDSIVKLLSADDVARLRTEQPSLRTPEGEEYINLEQLHLGVQLAVGVPPPMGRLLMRRALHEDTWTAILVLLTTPNINPDGFDECPDTPRNA